MNWMYNRWTSLTFGLVSVIAVSTLNSCKDDEEVVNAKLAFGSLTKTVAEGEQNVKATLVLDKPAPTDIVVEYSLGGTATRKIGTTIAGDYEIVGTSGEIEIAKGATTGDITFNILADAVFEAEEKIIITLEDISSNQVDIDVEDEMEIIITGGSVTASFATAALTVNESDEDLHEIVVQLDQAATSNVIVTYEISGWNAEGMAIDSLSGFEEEIPSDYWDYYVDGKSGEVTIPAGQTSAPIKLNIWSDFILEGDEKIEITLKTSTGINVGAISKFTMTIKQENGKILALYWPEKKPDNTTPTDVDMDMFIWVKDPTEGYFPFIVSALPSVVPPEARIIPKTLADELATLLGGTVEFGASYVYYSGTVASFQIQSQLIDFVDGVAEPAANRDIRTATYTTANINPWDTDQGTEPQIAQTFVYTNGTYGSISAITTPTTGSRASTIEIPASIRRQINLPIHSNLKFK